MKPANEKNTGSHPMTQISRRDFLRTAAALGLSAGALTIFEQACTTAEILTTTPVPAPLPTAHPGGYLTTGNYANSGTYRHGPSRGDTGGE